MSKIHFLPVRHGDAFIIECTKEDELGVIFFDVVQMVSGLLIKINLKELVKHDIMFLQHTLVQISQNMLRTSKLSKPIRRIVRKCIGSSIM